MTLGRSRRPRHGMARTGTRILRRRRQFLVRKAQWVSVTSASLNDEQQLMVI